MTKDEAPIKILIVDDNAQYREALGRTLLLEDYSVTEAGGIDEALRSVQASTPDVVVTDLQMGTEREGLDLIEILRGYDPSLPVIMISAVGSFEEGALATQLGAVHVIHKSRIEEEMDTLLSTIRKAHRDAHEGRAQLALISRTRDLGDQAEAGDIEAVRNLLADPNVDPHIKGEAYDFIAAISEGELQRESESNMRDASASAQYQELSVAALARLKENVPGFKSMQEDSRKALTTAECLYGMQGEGGALDFSRSIAFSYCFAVENEVRARLKGKMTRLGADSLNHRIFEACVDRRSRRVDMHFQQALFMATRNRGIKFTTDNVRDVILRLIHRKGKFRADGLKDVGILLLCFAREYQFQAWGQRISVNNPMNVKGLQYEDEVITLAGLLIALQYARNPYIHADVKKKEQLGKLREIAFNCLNELAKVA